MCSEMAQRVIAFQVPKGNGPEGYSISLENERSDPGGADLPRARGIGIYGR